MMDIVMLVAGAGVGAMLRDLFVLHRGDKSKTRQQLESKTPYDYALTNAINERDRLQGELVTIQALKRTEADTERIRNEIGTILSEDGDEATEGTYEPNIGMPIQDNGDGTFSPITWDILLRGLVREDDSGDEQSTEDDVERSLTKAVRESFENKETIRVTWRDSSENLRFRRGVVDVMSTGDGKVKEFGIRGLEIFARDVVRIMKGDDINGETLYRKGSR